MSSQLEAFNGLVEEYERTIPQYDLGADGEVNEYLGDQQLLNKLLQTEPTIKRILHLLDPALVIADLNGTYSGLTDARDRVQRGIGIIREMDNWAERLARESPTLAADLLHSWVWDAARTFWESQHFRAAVHAAASAINAHTQTKLDRRDVADDKLMQEAFSERPADRGRPRLRIPGDPSTPTVQSRQRGALHLGLACFFGIRNPAAHDLDDLPEQEALEQLATLSVLARLIDSCDVSRWGP